VAFRNKFKMVVAVLSNRHGWLQVKSS
jgi:hypothetical protein